MPLASISSHTPAHVVQPPVAGSLIPTTPHADAAAAAKTDLVGGKRGEIRTETLDNGVRIIIAERPGAASTKVQIGIGAGSMQDPTGKLGAAHLLEHLAFEGSPTTSGAKQEDIRSGLGGIWNAYTNQQSVVYYGVVPKQSAETGAALLTDMFANPNLSAEAVSQERAAVKNEILYRRPMGIDSYEAFQGMVFGSSPRANNIIGTAKSIDAITTKDLKTYHQNYFNGRNTVVLVEGDAKSLPLDTIRAELSKLPAGGRVDHSGEQLKVVPGKAIQQIPGDDTDAVELAIALPISREAYEKVSPLERRLVQTSLNEVLHERMRRHHDLTYGTSASFMLDDASDGALLVIETAVAPDAVRAATRDMLAIAEDARDGFGPKTLEAHKQIITSRLTMKEPSTTVVEPLVADRAEQAFQDALTKPGVTIPPGDAVKPKTTGAQRAANTREMKKLDAITPKQFAQAASSLVSLEDAKILVVGDGTAADVRAGMRDAGIDTKGVKSLDPIIRRGDKG
jgi:predicted Zn-dependent peptidase